MLLRASQAPIVFSSLIISYISYTVHQERVKIGFWLCIKILPVSFQSLLSFRIMTFLVSLFILARIGIENIKGMYAREN